MKRFIPLLLIILSLLPVLDLVRPGLPVGHDTPDHVARIANFYQSLSEGNLIPRWAGNLNWGYGHPILMFLYPLPSYVASLFHVIGFSFVDSTKLVFGVAYILSALTMYLWMSSAFGKRAGLIGALLYIFAPYRFVDLYVRGAIGEHVAFVFPPLVFYGMLGIAKNHRSKPGGVITALSMAGLLLSHNAIALMILPLIALYVVYLFTFESKHSPNYLLLTTYYLLLGFALSAFFWIPALVEGKYTLRDIVTAGEALHRFVPWTWFLYSSWNYGSGEVLSKFLGFGQWIGIVLSIMVIGKSKDQTLRIMLVGALSMLIVSLFMMTEASSGIWQRIVLLQKFQFPWRFLSLSVLASAVLGGISIPSLLQKNKHILLIAFCFLTIFSTATMWHPSGYEQRDESVYSAIFPSTTDTGESSPIWSIRAMGQRPTHLAFILSGIGTITEVFRNTTHRQYAVTAEDQLRIAENTLYFPGWKVFIDGKESQIEFQDPANRGIITYYVPAGNHVVNIYFSNTKVREVANSISIISLGLFFVWFIMMRLNYYEKL